MKNSIIKIYIILLSGLYIINCSGYVHPLAKIKERRGTYEGYDKSNNLITFKLGENGHFILKYEDGTILCDGDIDPSSHESYFEFQKDGTVYTFEFTDNSTVYMNSEIYNTVKLSRK